MATSFNGIDQYADVSNITSGVRTRTKLTLTEDFGDTRAGNQHVVDGRVGVGAYYLGVQPSSSVFAGGDVFLRIGGVNQSTLSSSNAPAGTVLELDASNASNNGSEFVLFARNDQVEFLPISISLVEIWNSNNTVLLHSFDLSNPNQAIVNDSVGSGVLTLVGFNFPTGPTLTGPDSTTDGTATQATGTDLDTVTTFSLVSDVSSLPQVIDGKSPTTLDYVANSGVGDCVPNTPAFGVPLQETVAAAGITPFQIVQSADDGTVTTNRNITLNAPTTHDVIQTTLETANTTPGVSIFGTNIIAVENNMQAYAPKSVNGMNITWAADGTFTTDADQTETIRVSYFSPAAGQWGCIDLTIKNSAIISGTASGFNEAAIEFFVESTGTERRSFNESAVAYYGSVSTTTSRQFNDLQRAAQKEEGFQGYWPGDRGN